MSQEIAVALLRAVENGVIGNAEISQAAALAGLLKAGHTLSVTQFDQATRILSRHHDQLVAAGIEVPVRAFPAGGASCLPGFAAQQPQKPGPNTPMLNLRWIAVNAGKVNETRERRIAVANAYALKDALKAVPGAKPHKDGQGFVWHYPATPAAAGAVMAVVGPARPMLTAGVQDLVNAFHTQADAITVVDEDTPLPSFSTADLIHDRFSLWGHQRRSVELMSQFIASAQAIPMGGGKTLSTITAINRRVREQQDAGRTDTYRVLIVCPNAVRGVWPREVRKFSKVRWHIVNGKKPSKRARSGWVDIAGAGARLAEAERTLLDCHCGADVHAAVVNYDILSREPWKSWHPTKTIDDVVYDEVHRLKAHNGQISRTCAKWVSWSARRTGLSGTMMPQTPLDIFGIYRALDPGIYGPSWTFFRSRYAVTNPHIEQQVVGYKNIPELAEKFFSIAYRPTVDLDLPPVVDITRECVLEKAAREIYDSLDDEMWASVTQYTEVMGDGALQVGDTLDRFASAYEGGELNEEWVHEEDGERTVTPANIMVKLLRLQQLTGGTVHDDEGNRVRVSHAKQNLLAEVLDEVGCSRGENREPEPVIVFCRFRSDLDAVAEVAAQAGLTYGEVSGRSKSGLSADSEMAEFDVVGVQIQSGGTGVDLTRSRVGIWYSLGYSLSDYDQARKRMDRPGQTRSVTFVHLLAEDTADFEVYGALDSRRSVIHGVMASHGVDATQLGFREQVVQDGEHGDGKAVAAPLPFDSLLKAENARIGEPMRSMA